MAAVVPLSRRPYDFLFIVYFVLHIATTVAVDTQIVLPRALFPKFLVQALDDWVRDSDDVLTGTRPLFYRAFVWVELVFHLPYFFFALYAFIKGRNWIRNISMVYAVAVLGSMVAIMPEAWDRSHAPLQTKLLLQSVLAIWCLIPLLLLKRVWAERVFDFEETSSKTEKKKQ